MNVNVNSEHRRTDSSLNTKYQLMNRTQWTKNWELLFVSLPTYRCFIWFDCSNVHWYWIDVNFFPYFIYFPVAVISIQIFIWSEFRCLIVKIRTSRSFIGWNVIVFFHFVHSFVVCLLVGSMLQNSSNKQCFDLPCIYLFMSWSWWCWMPLKPYQGARHKI